MLMRYSWKWSAGLQVRQSNSQLVQEIHSFLLNSNINTVLYFCCTLLLEEHLSFKMKKNVVGFSLCCRHRFKHGCRDGVCKLMYICAQVRERNKYFFPLFPKISEVFTLWMMWIMLDCTCEVGLGAGGFVTGAAEGPGWPGVTVLRLWAATSQTSHLAVCPVHHLYELSHPGERWKEVRKD